MATELTPNKVRSKEYREVASKDSTKVKAGETASQTYYLTPDGKVTTKQPEQSKVFVQKGETFSPAVADTINGK